ncbi:FtsK/SpoIIIE domain-containing protein [Actinosynnema mirum]|uniref:DNA segregation ATPase FtsK/SpoIIIE-related protein n=1 Tax=Actinosynnema mirum (strain ATCC 29888 / DSM 43827 / JCM 3225 / NBRC 14064 / NCIMB 13271 / NRRL B-12336 / IMRU 3971 / 101) TaxID=446462 RepID=C6WME7_ACTMD|nr:FtsK/SpoIIIE domain-containing protein [Actinosynnema mirum]ACU34881.1 DNA segregation ATPase FtsK/SpoIIIE-related protein [Actinosynnema mirum DSM 43827]
MPRPDGSRWVDPAPLEVARPRLPWWVLLPWWSLWIVVPTALVVLLVRLAVRLLHRYPLVLLLPAGLVVVRWWGWSVLVLVLLVLVAGVLIWWGLHQVSCWRLVVRPVLSQWRRASVYAFRWRTTMRLANLANRDRGREYLPRLRVVRSEGWRDRVRVRMIPAQSPEAWELRRDSLAHSFGARSCRVRVLRPRVVELDLIHRDPLVRPLSVSVLGGVVDLKRVVVGRTENGKPWRLRLLGSQVLVVGVPGAGKGSVLWSVVWQLAPAVRDGLVRLVGVDPKGGMELGQCPDAFDRVVYDSGPEAVALLEEIAAEVKERAARYRGVRRLWARSGGEPFTVLVIDELADLIAYQPDRQLRERASRAVQTITSQGRAPGYAVVGLVQDPRKEVVGFRHLFTTRVALRLDEPQQVDMVLGDGVRQRGAAAHEISESTPGVAWMKEDGRREPERARAFHVTDSDLARLREYFRPAEVRPFPARPEGVAA